MRPPRSDIALPPLPPAVEWVIADPKRIEPHSARGPVLVAFLEFGDPHSVRTIPYLQAWHQRYHSDGLTVLGVHTPKLTIATDNRALEAAARRLGISFAVINDHHAAIWHEYGCQGWPSLFLWRIRGSLFWTQFGEHEMCATETEIRRLLIDAAASRDRPPPALAKPIGPLRPEHAPAAPLRVPSDPLAPGGPGRPRRTDSDSESLEVDYEGGSAWATLSGNGRIWCSLDAAAEAAITLSGPGAYELATHRSHSAHHLSIRAEPTVELWALAFAPGRA